MTEKEWIAIGYQNHVIEACQPDTPSFGEAYRDWFTYKRGQIRPQSLDRIECTFNKYYAGSPLLGEPISSISEQAVIDFLNGIFAKYGSVTLKEYHRVYQIVNNVLCYALDFRYAGARLLNWKMVKGYSYTNHVVSSPQKGMQRVKDSDISAMRDFVLAGGYPARQSACLLLVFNFYAGLRVGELAALEWQDIDWGRRLLHVCRGEVKSFCRDEQGERTGGMRYDMAAPKTAGSVRTVPLCQKGLDLLRLLKLHHDRMGYQSRRLVYDGRDAVGAQSLDKALRRLCSMLEITPFSTHMIRKTVATKLHHAGIPTRVVSDVLGHSDISTTEKCYILSDAEYLATLSGSLDSALSY